MPDNRLQIIAEMIDKVSPAAKKMERAFADLNRATSKDFPQAFKKYQTAVAANEKALTNFGRRSESTRREIRAFQDLIVRTSPVVGRMTELIGAFAIGTGSAIAAVGAVGAALVVAGKSAVDFAEKMKELQFGSKSSGLSITDMHQTQQALEQLNISTDVSKQAFDSLRSTMSDMKFNTEAYIKSLDGLPDGFKGLANVLIMTAKSGAGTKEVFEKIQEQVDYLQEKYPGARGVDIAKRYVTSVARLPAVFGEHGLKEINEKLQVIKTLGASDTEIKEAAVQAERLRKAMLENTTILGKWRLNLNTYVTVQFLKVIDLLDLIEAKYNAWFGSSINSFFGGSVGSSPSAPGGGSFSDRAWTGGGGGGGPQGAGPRQYGGSSGGGAAPGGGGGADTPFSGRFGTWSPAAVGGHAGHIPSSATGPLGNTRTGGSNIGGPPLPTSYGDTGYTGVGGYNFMGSQRAAAMGMGDVQHGGALAHLPFATGIPKGEGPVSITANKYAGPDMAGFLKDLHDAGAPLGQFAGAYVNKPLQHGYGNALDIETGFGSGPDNSPLLYAWAQAHPKEFAEIQARHHMRNLDTSSGARMHDWGHFEWTHGRAPAPAVTGHRDWINSRWPLTGISRQQSRADLDAANTAPTTITGSGKISVDVSGAVGKTAISQGIFKNLNVERQVQMQPANAGPAQGASPL